MAVKGVSDVSRIPPLFRGDEPPKLDVRLIVAITAGRIAEATDLLRSGASPECARVSFRIACSRGYRELALALLSTGSIDQFTAIGVVRRAFDSGKEDLARAILGHPNLPRSSICGWGDLVVETGRAEILDILAEFRDSTLFTMYLEEAIVAQLALEEDPVLLKCVATNRKVQEHCIEFGLGVLAKETIRTKNSEALQLLAQMSGAATQLPISPDTLSRVFTPIARSDRTAILVAAEAAGWDEAVCDLVLGEEELSSEELAPTLRAALRTENRKVLNQVLTHPQAHELSETELKEAVVLAGKKEWEEAVERVLLFRGLAPDVAGIALAHSAHRGWKGKVEHVLERYPRRGDIGHDYLSHALAHSAVHRWQRVVNKILLESPRKGEITAPALSIVAQVAEEQGWDDILSTVFDHPNSKVQASIIGEPTYPAYLQQLAKRGSQVDLIRHLSKPVVMARIPSRTLTTILHYAVAFEWPAVIGIIVSSKRPFEGPHFMPLLKLALEGTALDILPTLMISARRMTISPTDRGEMLPSLVQHGYLRDATRFMQEEPAPVLYTADLNEIVKAVSRYRGSEALEFARAIFGHPGMQFSVDMAPLVRHARTQGWADVCVLAHGRRIMAAEALAAAAAGAGAPHPFGVPEDE